MKSVSKTRPAFYAIVLFSMFALASCSKTSDQPAPPAAPPSTGVLPPILGGAFTFITGIPSMVNSYSVNLMYHDISGDHPQFVPIPLVQYSSTTPISNYPITSATLFGTHGETLALYNNIIPDSNSWTTRQMVDTNNVPQGYWIMWNPKADAIIITDKTITLASGKP
jgi:hypothetical protein